jgi:Ribbon-helix-helix protein, copG family
LSVEIDYKKAYQDTRSLNQVAALAGVSRNTAKARIVAAGGEIQGRGGANGHLPQYETFNITLDERLYQRLARLARDSGLSKAEVLRRAIELYLRRKKSQPEQCLESVGGWTISVEVAVKPDTLARLKECPFGKFDAVRKALKGASLDSLNPRQSKKSI